MEQWLRYSADEHEVAGSNLVCNGCISVEAKAPLGCAMSAHVKQHQVIKTNLEVRTMVPHIAHMPVSGHKTPLTMPS